MSNKTLIIDNYDSFTYNLYQYVGEEGGNPIVYRNDKISLDEVREINPSHLIISPGPGNPYTQRDIGISEEIIGYAIEKNIPLFGVCLGHQIIGKYFGATVSKAPTIYHGKASIIALSKPISVIFEGLETKIEAMRYHSLCIEKGTIGDALIVTAISEDGIIMAVEHKSFPIYGIQFHPESIGTSVGKNILKNFLSLCNKKNISKGQSFVLGSCITKKPKSLLAAKDDRKQTRIKIMEDCVIGDSETVVMISGPCSVESQEQLDETAAMVSEQGIKILRGGAFKPRTGPYCFHGLGEEGLKLLRKTADKYGMATVSEAMSPDQVELVENYCDIIQVGARNMQNYDLLRKVGKSTKPVLLKRGLASTLKEFLMAAEYILSNGNEKVILCERGIRTFEQEVRFTLCLGSIQPLREMTHLPIIVDPSHAAGRAGLVMPNARAAIAVGCDGLIFEVHCNPEEALSDGPQSLNKEQLAQCMKDIHAVSKALNKRVI